MKCPFIFIVIPCFCFTLLFSDETAPEAIPTAPGEDNIAVPAEKVPPGEAATQGEKKAASSWSTWGYATAAVGVAAAGVAATAISTGSSHS